MTATGIAMRVNDASAAKRLARGLLWLLLAAAPAAAQEGLEILIDTGVEDPLPIAVVPFGWAGAPASAPIDLHVTIANNLERSGRFFTIDPLEMPQRPTDYSKVNFKDWQVLQMENLVIGHLKEAAVFSP